MMLPTSSSDDFMPCSRGSNPLPHIQAYPGSPPRGGLLELFYGVYEKDADRCLTALTAMGVLVPTGDM